MPLDVGTKLGAFEITGLLGKGGMGEVYRARDTKLGRDVAIKVLPEEVAADTEYLARFEREAVALAALNHPNVAGIHGFHHVDGMHLLEMELVEGETLSERIEKGRLPVSEALPIFIQIAEGLEAAHERKLVHRDLKPANIKITPKGVVKILDFGMAKETGLQTPQEVSHSAATKPVSPSPGTLTTAGMILGTPNYMSPEQARGLSVDRRTDIWAFGCCLYQALTGEIPFQGSTVMDILSSVLERAPDFGKIPSPVPRQLLRVLRRCLEKDPDQRLHDIADARISLVEASNAPEYDEPGAGGRRRSSPFALALAAVVGAILGGAAIWAALGPWTRASVEVSEPVRRFTIPIGETFRPRQSFMPIALSRDGSMLAYAGIDSRDARTLFVHDLGTGKDTPLSGGESAVQPFFSPDGSWVGFVSQGSLKKQSIRGGAPTVLVSRAIGPRGAAWGPEGSIVYSMQNGDQGLERVAATGGEPQAVTAVSGDDTDHRWPQILPGGEYVLFTARIGSGMYDDAGAIYVASIKTGEQKEILRGGYHGRYVTSGHLVFAFQNTLMAVPFDLGRMEVVGEPVPVLNDVRTNRGLGFAFYDVSDDGLLVYASGGDSGGETRLVWVDLDGKEEVLPVPAGLYSNPAISPDGARVAVTVEYDIYLYNVVRGTLTRLTFEGSTNVAPTWTHDGQTIVFSSVRESSGAEGFQTFRKQADGTGTASEIPFDVQGLSVIPSSVTPDGSTVLAYTVGASTGFDMWAVPMDGSGKARTLLQTRFQEGRMRLSPDGNWLAYSSDESGKYEVYVQNYPEMSGKWQVSAGGGAYPLWAPDMSHVYYRSETSVMAVNLDLSENFSAGVPYPLFADKYFNDSGYQWDISPDGEGFLMLEFTDTGVGAQNSQPVYAVTNWFEELNRLVPIPEKK